MAFGSLIPWRSDKKNMPVRRDAAEDPVHALQTEMNRMFEDFQRGFGFDLQPFSGGIAAGWSPLVNVSEDDKEVRVDAELPGLDDKHIEVSLSDDALTIKGEKSEEKEQKDKNFHRIERSFGSFQRVIPLPAKIDADKVDANFKNGVLSVRLPKVQTEQQTKKKIEVKA